MCPVVLLALIFSFLLLLLEVTAALNVTFTPKNVTYNFYEEQVTEVNFAFEDKRSEYENDTVYEVLSDNRDVALISNVSFNMDHHSMNSSGIFFNGSFFVKGEFLGFASARVVKKRNGKTVETSQAMPIEVRRKANVAQKAFVYSVIVLVTLNYINMGCALDLNVVKSVLKKPIAPCVGFFSQYAIMPLVAYGLAKLLFDSPALQYGLFTFGCSPGGGASNMWTVLLKGNLNLSLTMTFISVLAALGMMPLWLFTLGKKLFVGTTTESPYHMIFYTLGSMLVFLGIGLIFQRYRPRVAKFCCRILVPVSIAMIIFIIIFGTYANLYMFRLFTWEIMLAATCNVWLGFIFGAVVSKIARLTLEDMIAISVETGVQNTGIAIAIINITFSVSSVQADLASVVPVAASIMTPFPLVALYCVQKGREFFSKKKDKRNEYVLDDECDERRALPSPNSADSLTVSKSVSNGYIY